MLQHSGQRDIATLFSKHRQGSSAFYPLGKNRAFLSRADAQPIISLMVDTLQENKQPL